MVNKPTAGYCRVYRGSPADTEVFHAIETAQSRKHQQILSVYFLLFINRMGLTASLFQLSASIMGGNRREDSAYSDNHQRSYCVSEMKCYNIGRTFAYCMSSGQGEIPDRR